MMLGRRILWLLTATAGVAVAVACGSFGAEDPRESADASTPGDGSDGASPSEAGPAVVMGPYCPDAGAHDFCWDFTDASPPAFGFTFSNQSGLNEAGVDFETFTSAPAAFSSYVGGAASQSAARLGQDLTLKPGVYTLRFALRHTCGPLPNKRPTLAELYCTSVRKGSIMRFEAQLTPDDFEVDVFDTDGGPFSPQTSVPLRITRDKWVRVEIAVTVGLNGGVSVSVDGIPVGSKTTPVGCAPGSGLQLLLGGQFNDPVGECRALFDDVTLDIPR